MGCNDLVIPVAETGTSEWDGRIAHTHFLFIQLPTSMKALLNGTVIAESDETVVVENNHYFPPASLKEVYLETSDHRTTCPWKGEAHYYDVVVDGERKKNAAWYYPEPSDAASEIKGHVAFYTSKVDVTDGAPA